MTDANPPSAFFAKLWVHYLFALGCTGLFLFCAVLGPLFLTGIMKPADGRPGTDAGIAMSIIAVPMGLAASLGWFNVVMHHKPVLRICAEGIQINLIGCSSLDGVPLLPGWVHVAWLIVSTQGFRSRVGWIPWQLFRCVRVSGLPLCRTLTIEATILYLSPDGQAISAVGSGIAFRDAQFCDRLEVVAAAIQTHYRVACSRNKAS